MLCCNLLLCGSAGSFLSGCQCPHVGFGGTEGLDGVTIQTTSLLGKVHADVLHSGVFKSPGTLEGLIKMITTCLTTSMFASTYFPVSLCMM